MLELLCMSILGASYVYACIDERAKEKKLKEEERIFELKLKVFWYAVSNNRLYNDVVKDLENGTLSWDEIERANNI